MTHPQPIEICPHSEVWVEWFESERNVLASVFSSPTVAIEHIGSTAVPGLSAKPIVDILLGASTLDAIEARLPALAATDYQYMPEHEAVLPQRRFLAKPQLGPPRFHLHAVVLGGEFWATHLAFRDALRSDPKLARAYEQLKRDLADHFGFDRTGYTEAKSAFIRSVLAGACKMPKAAEG
jgi:GrpB-like predicted nucleotidyltransferase (UPF0157 family)